MANDEHKDQHSIPWPKIISGRDSLGLQDFWGSLDSREVLFPLASDHRGPLDSDSGYGSRSHSDHSSGSYIPDVETEFGGFRNGDSTAVESIPLLPNLSTPSHTCPECNRRFRTKAELNKHLHRHRRPYTCPYSNCTRQINGFTSQNDLIRHKRTVHGELASGRNFACPHEPCNKKELKIWPRADHFRSHLQRVHQLVVNSGDDLRDYVHQDADDRRKESDSLAAMSSRTGSIPIIQENDALPGVGVDPAERKYDAFSYVSFRGSLPPSNNTPLPNEPSKPIVASSGLPAGTSWLGERGAEAKVDTGGQRKYDMQESLGAEFAAQLFKRAIRHPLDSETTEKISRRLSELLKHYAHMAGYKSSGQLQRDVLPYSHKFQKSVAQHFSTLCEESLSMSLAVVGVDSADPKTMGTQFLDNLQQRVEGVGLSNHLDDLSDLSEKDDSISDDLPSSLDFDSVVNNGPFKWLLSRLNRELQHRSNAESINKIGQHIESYVDTARSAENTPCQATFKVRFCLADFWNRQSVEDHMPKRLSKLISVTGSYEDAQALTCGQYLTQTWPVTGPQVLQHLDAVSMGGAREKHSDTLDDGTQMTSSWTASLRRGCFMVDASGTSASILDLGELLAWLGATLQASPDPLRLARVRPAITTSAGAMVTAKSIKCVHQISFEVEEVDDTSPSATSSSNGRCWHDLFKNPVIVTGYPIAPKARPESGIEIPLKVMAAMVGSEQIDEFDGKNFIKGFSRMLVPVEKDGDAIYWHLYRSEDQDRIPFWHPTTSHAAYIDSVQMERCRHILGWTLEAEFYAGYLQANYEIANSYLDSPGSQSPFSGISVTQGSYITGGPSFMICQRDTDLTIIGRTGRVKRLKWLVKQKVLLWDDADKRGWLVNGLSALLHLVRASLHNDSTGISGSHLLFRPELLQEPEPNKLLPTAAAYVLFNGDNLDLKVYDEEHGTFGDLVDLFYNILEKLIDYQKRVSGDNGANMTRQPRRILEGWDFHDLMANHDDRMFPWIVTLEPAGMCWVDFIRSQSIVTLFGSGFGDLIKPTGDMCSKWEKLPCGESYIAASLSDLKDLMNVQRCPQTVTRLGRSIWHTETDLFHKCSCDEDTHEPVQSLVPQFMSRSIPGRDSSIPTSDAGAVIFGSHSKSALVWSDFGPPSTGILGAAFEKSDTMFSDSGVGSSMASLSTSETTHSVSSAPGRYSRTPDNTAELRRTPSKVTHDPYSYTVAIICALAREYVAVRALLDQTFSAPETPEVTEGDTNIYTFGQMGQHMVVSTCLPATIYGNNPATSCAENMRRSFSNLQFCFLVGVGGGIPSPSADIRLGDVVVGCGAGALSAVIQYDRGKENSDGIFERTGSLSNPPTRLLGAIAHIRSDPQILSLQNPLEVYLDEIRARMSPSGETRYQYPGSDLDVLLESSPDGLHLLPKQRPPRDNGGPVIHYGPIASGNRVIKSAEFRDRQAREHGVLCFDMEAAGVAVAFSSQLLVVRGICDYSDSQKNKDWQDYAAATAAAYVKLLLSVVPATTRRPAREWEEHSRKRMRTDP